MKKIRKSRILFYKIFRKACRFSKINRLEALGNNLYHATVKSELNDLFLATLKKTELDLTIGNSNNSNIIWFFWWQGIDNAPKLVKNCFFSLRKNSVDRDIVLLTKDNINQYVDLPQFIIDKVKSKKISITHFSDIVRFNLLKNYGGLWVDATILWFKPLGDNMFQKIYTAHGSPNLLDKNVSGGKWTSYLIGGSSHYFVFDFIDNFFNVYYSYNDKPIDYFMTDYVLNYLYENFSEFRNYIDFKAKDNNVNMYKGTAIMNKPISEENFNKISTKTNGLKLTYKIKISKDSNSVYNYLVSLINC